MISFSHTLDLNHLNHLNVIGKTKQRNNNNKNVHLPKPIDNIDNTHNQIVRQSGTN